MSEKEINKEELVKFLEHKIDELRRELSHYEALLYMLKGEKRKKAKPVKREEGRIITVDDDIVASVINLDNGIRVSLHESIPEEHTALNAFLIKLLEEKKSTGDIDDYELRGGKGYVNDIVIYGRINEITYTEIEQALIYVWKELKKGSR